MSQEQSNGEDSVVENEIRLVDDGTAEPDLWDSSGTGVGHTNMTGSHHT